VNILKNNKYTDVIYSSLTIILLQEPRQLAINLVGWVGGSVTQKKF